MAGGQVGLPDWVWVDFRYNRPHDAVLVYSLENYSEI